MVAGLALLWVPIHVSLTFSDFVDLRQWISSMTEREVQARFASADADVL